VSVYILDDLGAVREPVPDTGSEIEPEKEKERPDLVDGIPDQVAAPTMFEPIWAHVKDAEKLFSFGQAVPGKWVKAWSCICLVVVFCFYQFFSVETKDYAKEVIPPSEIAQKKVLLQASKCLTCLGNTFLVRV
jgi:hypothetical protein